MAEAVSTIVSTLKRVLGDPTGQALDDTTVLGYINDAQTTAANELRANGVERFRLQTIFTVAAGTTALEATPAAGGSPPAGTEYLLPSNFFQPIVLEERGVGEAVGNFQPVMEVREQLPNVEPTDALKFWNSFQGQIRLIAATKPREVKLDYLCSFTRYTAATQTVYAAASENAIAFLAASLHADANGNHEAAARFDGRYNTEIENITNPVVDGRQRRPQRRRSYYSGR